MHPSRHRAARWWAAVLLLPTLAPRPVCAELFLNEFMADNRGVVRDAQGEADDWLELYNTGPGAVDVGGMHLSDDLTRPTKHRLPDDAPASTTIPAGGFLLLWADGDVDDGPLHLPFKLDGDGEALGLFDAGGAPLDRLTFGAQPADVSLGRLPDGGGGWGLLLAPTPGAPNSAPLQGFVAAPNCAPPRGFYDGSVTVAIACPTSGAADPARLADYLADLSYDPTNGTVSDGDIFRIRQ